MAYPSAFRITASAMQTFLKTCAWVLGFAALAYLVTVAWVAATDHGQFTLTINGQNVEGTQKVFLGSAGLIVAGVIALIAFGVAAIAIVGSSVLVFAIFALVGIVLVAVALPFLLPIAIPVVLLVVLFLALRQPKPKNVA
jgi:hypothetical protein